MIQELSIRRWVREDAFGALHRALFAFWATSGSLPSRRLLRRSAMLAVLATVFASAIAVTSVGAEGVAPSTPSLGQLGVHVVQPGENLFSIATRYRMGIGALARLNATTTDAYLLPGRPMWVPLASAVNSRADSPAEPRGDGELSGAIGGADGATEDASKTTYVVAPGDTLFSLSQRLGASIDDLKRWNGLPLDGALRAGDTLVLYGAGERNLSPTRDETSEKTRTAYQVTVGDTLSSIATRFGTTPAGLRSANGLAGDNIHAGQTLLVPRKGSGAAASGGAKRIEVDVSEQRMYVWQGDELVWNFTASTGMAGYGTRRGSFAVQSKIPNAWSSPWQLWMPNWLGIYWAGGSENGIHALPIINGQRLWAGYLGTPISYGCVVLGIPEAELLYNWADIGTPVTIHD